MQNDLEKELAMIDNEIAKLKERKKELLEYFISEVPLQEGVCYDGESITISYKKETKTEIDDKILKGILATNNELLKDLLRTFKVSSTANAIKIIKNDYPEVMSSNLIKKTETYKPVVTVKGMAENVDVF